jgi:hypothetical protein
MYAFNLFNDYQFRTFVDGDKSYIIYVYVFVVIMVHCLCYTCPITSRAAVVWVRRKCISVFHYKIGELNSISLLFQELCNVS